MSKRTCHCCGGKGWHESECGGQHFCQACGGTGSIEPVIDMGYLSLPAGVQAEIESAASGEDATDG